MLDELIGVQDEGKKDTVSLFSAHARVGHPETLSTTPVDHQPPDNGLLAIRDAQVLINMLVSNTIASQGSYLNTAAVWGGYFTTTC